MKVKVLSSETLQKWRYEEERLLENGKPLPQIIRSSLLEDKIRALVLYRLALRKRGVVIARNVMEDLNYYVQNTLLPVDNEPPWDLLVYKLPFSPFKKELIAGCVGAQVFVSNMDGPERWLQTPTLKLLASQPTIGLAATLQFVKYALSNAQVDIEQSNSVLAEAGRTFARPYEVWVNYKWSSDSLARQTYQHLLRRGLSDIVDLVAQKSEPNGNKHLLAITIIAPATLYIRGNRIEVTNPVYPWLFRLREALGTTGQFARVTLHILALLSQKTMDLFGITNLMPSAVVHKAYTDSGHSLFGYIIVLSEDFVDLPYPYNGVGQQWKQHLQELQHQAVRKRLYPLSQAAWSASLVLATPK